MDSDQSHPLVRAAVATGGAIFVNIVEFTQILQLLAAFVACVYSIVVLVDWFVKRRKKGE